MSAVDFCSLDLETTGIRKAVQTLDATEVRRAKVIGTVSFGYGHKPDDSGFGIAPIKHRIERISLSTIVIEPNSVRRRVVELTRCSGHGLSFRMKLSRRVS